MDEWIGQLSFWWDALPWRMILAQPSARYAHVISIPAGLGVGKLRNLLTVVCRSAYNIRKPNPNLTLSNNSARFYHCFSSLLLIID